ncbi:MAG TPA: hypothetical protein VJT72_08810 [Pseudonocardiaceae bacterium]|nr:hypothetical protein [Pseudonocardiaceae bacterium]
MRQVRTRPGLADRAVKLHAAGAGGYHDSTAYTSATALSGVH